MKKLLAIYFAVHLFVFASFYYVNKYAAPEAYPDEITAEAVPDKALVLAGRFENILNHLSGITTHKVENYTENADGTFTVFTKVDTETGKGDAVSLFERDGESNLGYKLIYCDIIDLGSLNHI